MANEPSGSELFESYQTEYNNLTAAVSRRINSQIPGLSGEKKKEVIRTAEREIEEAEEILEQMDVELRSLPSATRAKLQQRYKTFKADLSQLRKDLKRVSTSGERDELFAGAVNDLDRTSADQRQRLLDNNARLDASSKRLEDAQRLAMETEEVGEGVLRSLQGQREQLENASRTLDEVDDTLGKSGRILKGMARRVVTNKIITALIILVLLGIIGLIIWKTVA